MGDVLVKELLARTGRRGCQGAATFRRRINPGDQPGPSQIAFDARYIGSEPTGIGQVCLQLLTDLARLELGPGLKILINRQTDLPPELWSRDNLEFWEAPWDPRGLANQLFLPRLLKRLQVRVLHSVDCFCPLAARRVSHLVTVHDLIPLHFPDLKSKKARLLPLWKTWLKLQCARAKRIITVSRQSREDLIRMLNVAPDKVQVLYNPVRRWSEVQPVSQFRRRWGLRGPVASYVGRHEPYKNLVPLVRAAALVLEHFWHSDFRLVVAGRPDPRYPQAREEVRRLGLANHVLFTGYLDDASLGALYQTSAVFVFPSQYEGFGLPPVEAMGFGTPVVSGRYPAAREVLGKAALFVDAQDPRAIATGILRVLKDPDAAHRLRTAGRQRAARYCSGLAARQHLEMYQAILRTSDSVPPTRERFQPPHSYLFHEASQPPPAVAGHEEALVSSRLLLE
jgi:alpha-1,3-rhamnosyl/mannosyltransferase